MCYDIAFSPDGTKLVTGVGSRVLVYDAADGNLLHSLKAHKDAVYCVSYSRDGKKFASGGADRTIIIWSSKAEGVLKYTHNESIQALAYNPTSAHLASATAVDFGLWAPDQKAVVKHKVSAKILSLAWTNDGQYLALGQFDGVVSVRDRSGGEKMKIKLGAPVWTLAWNPNRDEPHDVLACGCWDESLSFYQLNGTQVGKDIALDYDPCTVRYFSNGEYMVTGGTNRKVTLATKEGTPLKDVCVAGSWVWCAAPRPKQNYVAVGCEDGSITMHQLIFSTVHGLYKDRYAYRDYMTDVIIQHLVTEQKLRIKCKDYVKRISVYKETLAVQLPKEVIIYDLLEADSYEMQYREKTRIMRNLECNLLVVTSHHIVLCLEKKLQLYDFEGKLEREWTMESVIRYIKVVGGPDKGEGILVGLKSGVVFRIFINNSHPVQLIEHGVSIRCLDQSFMRQKLAVVDDNSEVTVYDLETKKSIFTDTDANSVSFNSEFEEMLCYSGNGQLSIKTGDFPVHRQKLEGFVVGFKASKIFCLHYVSMQTIDVPQSMSMWNYVKVNNFDMAHSVACLGVTEKDWSDLGFAALFGMNLAIARKAFIRVRDLKYLELIDKCEEGVKNGDPSEMYLAEALAYQGKFHEAAKMFAKANRVDKAMEMFSDLRQFDEAKKWAEEYAHTKGGDSTLVQEFVHRQAEWAEEVSDYAAAATMYIQAKKFDKAIDLIAKNGWKDKLIEVTRALGASDVKHLKLCAMHFAQWGDHVHARDVYTKLGDDEGLLSLLVDAEQWEEAFIMLQQHPQHVEKVYLPYARWLAENDRFDEARLAYAKAGRSDAATRMLEQLTHNAVLERRFQDAGHCYWLMSREIVSELPNDPRALLSDEDEAKLDRFEEFKDRAEMYYAYDFIYRAMDEPFRSSLPSTLLNIGQFLLSKFATRDEMPLGISLAYVLNTLAKHGDALGAYKLARFAYNKLQGLKIPASWQAQVDLACIVSRSKPLTDADDLLPMCYRCSATNPLVSGKGDVCVSCGGCFVRSFVTFEHLPMVEFEISDDITPKEARRLIREEPPERGGAASARRAYNVGGDEQFTFEDGPGAERGILGGNDAFAQVMSMPNVPIVCDRVMLRNLSPNEVVVKPSGCALIRPRYFRLMDTESPVTVDENGCFYEADEYELACLEFGRTPFTRLAVNVGDEVASAVEPETPPQRTSSSKWGTARGAKTVGSLDFAGN